MGDLVVAVTLTVMDGTVIRWYLSETAAGAGREILSASREGVMVRSYLHEVPDDVLAAAAEWHETLRRDPYADLSSVATHRRDGLFGPLVRIAEANHG